MNLLDIKLEKVFYSNDSTINGSFTQTKKVDGRKNNGRNLTQEDRSKGGKIAHQRGTAHQFSSREAQAAGRIGGKKSQRRHFQNDMESI